ncbi:hypothetical protein ABT143_35700 [Streptomyces sp. NPDC002033]|uniref:hypothetical protein n=1 Tax=unclassified Streptomyces TaxID=2593676 RepID=UPI00331F5602
MGAERAQGGRGWVRIPASRGEQAPGGAAGGTPYAGTPYGGSPHAGAPSAGTPYAGTPYADAPYADAPYAGTPYAPRSPAGAGAAGAFAPRDPAAIYLSLLKRWREAGRTLPGHPDEEWERLISQPCWPGR